MHSSQSTKSLHLALQPQLYTLSHLYFHFTLISDPKGENSELFLYKNISILCFYPSINRFHGPDRKSRALEFKGKSIFGCMAQEYILCICLSSI